MYLKGLNPRHMAPIRPPWLNQVGPIEFSPQILPLFVYWTNVLHVSLERDRPILAGEAIAILTALEESVRKAKKTRADVMEMAETYGVRLDFDLYDLEKQAYVQALLRGEIGEWSPVDENYPGYMALREHYYRRPTQLPSGVPRVHAPTMANERRLSVGDVLPGYKPGHQRFIRTSNMPAPSRKTLGYLTPGFHHQWWQRKVVGHQAMPEHRRGDILHWGA